jgi:hypothetical protein
MKLKLFIFERYKSNLGLISRTKDTYQSIFFNNNLFVNISHSFPASFLILNFFFYILLDLFLFHLPVFWRDRVRETGCNINNNGGDTIYLKFL